MHGSHVYVKIQGSPQTRPHGASKRIHGYLYKMRFGVIRIRTEPPDYSNIPERCYSWDYTCYQGAKEEIPKDTP